MALDEQIWDESVAGECGLFEGPDPDRVVGGAGEADIISLNGRSTAVQEPSSPTERQSGHVIVTDPEEAEADRVVTVRVKITYFGRPHNGDQVLEAFRQVCQREFVTVEIVDVSEGAEGDERKGRG
jgi:hypothetical protein